MMVVDEAISYQRSAIRPSKVAPPVIPRSPATRNLLFVVKKKQSPRFAPAPEAGSGAQGARNDRYADFHDLYESVCRKLS